MSEDERSPNYSGTATKTGRDHHKDAFTMGMTGGGVKHGITDGARPTNAHDRAH